MSVLRVKRLSENAVLPVRGSGLAAGYDLASAEDIVVPARGKAIAKTDLAMAIPLGHYGRIAPRSGFSWKKHTDIGAGVIDADYRGNVGVVIFNHSDEDISVSQGDRDAQLIIEQISTPVVEDVEGELDDTQRGEGGFGSTGMSSSS